jgi:hypothetical protein
MLLLLMLLGWLYGLMLDLDADDALDDELNER